MVMFVIIQKPVCEGCFLPDAIEVLHADRKTDSGQGAGADNALPG